MLPKVNRIKKKKDFETIFKNAKSFRTNLFIFKISKNTLSINRIGFVVSQKISKKATIRNKTRRRLAEIMAGHIENIKSGTDLVLIALPGIEKKEFSEIREAVVAALYISGLINK